jgi:alkylmercury lyase
MQHQLKLEDKTLYTWCAWDGLFIPELLKVSATLITQCPISKTRLSVFVDDQGSFETTPSEIVMSFLEPKQGMFDQDIIGQFCDYIYLFQDRETARQWTDSNPYTLLLDLAQAMELGRLKNQKQFGGLI